MINMLQRTPQGTKIVYDTHEKVVDMDILKLINSWCILKGSTYEGRKQAACALLNIRQKPPVLIAIQQRDIIFPLQDVKHPSCTWINYRSILEYKRTKSGFVITFFNDQMYEFLLDVRTLQRELYLCDQLLKIMLDHR